MSRIVAELTWRLGRESGRLIVVLFIIEMLLRTQGSCYELLRHQLGSAHAVDALPPQARLRNSHAPSRRRLMFFPVQCFPLDDS